MRGDHAVARTGMGPVTMRLRTHDETRVVDHVVELSGESRGVEAVFPGRVVPLPNGRSLFLFTAVQGPDQSTAEFEGEMGSLERELAALSDLLGG